MPVKLTLKTLGWGLVTLLSLAIVGYAALTYLPFDSARYPDFMRSSLQAHRLGLYLHVFASMFALAIGPFQFLPPFRAQHPVLHRWLGRVYLGIGVLIGGLSSLYLALFSYGGFPSHLGFICMGLTWLGTGLMAYLHIRRGQQSAHREWMIRNFSMTFAAVTVRLWLFVFEFIAPTLEAAYIADAWFCWVPNLIVAQLLIELPKTQARMWKQVDVHAHDLR